MGTGAAEHRAQGPGDSRSVKKRHPEGRRQVQPTSVNCQLSWPGCCSSHSDVATHTHTHQTAIGRRRKREVTFHLQGWNVVVDRRFWSNSVVLSYLHIEIVQGVLKNH